MKANEQQKKKELTNTKNPIRLIATFAPTQTKHIYFFINMYKKSQMELNFKLLLLLL